MITHNNMTRQERTMTHHDMVTDLAIMTDMRLSEQGAIIANNRHATLFRATVHRNKFAQRISIANSGVGHGPFDMFLILRVYTQGHKRIDRASLANACMSINHHMTFKTRTGANFNMLSNRAKRAYYAI
tara:strand:- start:145 stop:531 length:387 start_codon:yes stop_codon:yes gene_type:complete